MRTTAQTREHPQIGVTIYNDAGVPAPVVDEAKRTVSRIYLNAGIAIRWDEHTNRLPDGTQFSVRIVSRSLNLPGDDFGIAFVGTDGRGVQADVFYSGIERLARSSSINPADILGHVMAHELGHLLLGLNSHSNLGVMQAHWGEPQLRQMRMGALRFERRQEQAISTRVLNSQSGSQTVAALGDAI